jgi:hypothetical protein
MTNVGFEHSQSQRPSAARPTVWREFEPLPGHFSPYREHDVSGPYRNAPGQVPLGNAILWATGEQRWRPTNGAQSYMASEYRDPDEESPWTIVGIRDGDAVRPAPDGGGGVERFTTGPLGPKGPPGPTQP